MVTLDNRVDVILTINPSVTGYAADIGCRALYLNQVWLKFGPADTDWELWTLGSTSPLTTKGDIWASSTADARFPVVVADGRLLVTDTTTAFGFKWATLAVAGVAS